MGWPVTINGNTYTEANFSPYGYVTAFPAILGDLATVAAGIAAASTGIVLGSLTVTGTGVNTTAIGPNGTTNPTLQVDCSTASAATGLKIKSAAAASGVAVSVVSSGTNENLTLDAKGSGAVTIGGTSTGNITIGRAAAGALLVPYTTDSTSPSNGGAQFAGGVGIIGDLNWGGAAWTAYSFTPLAGTGTFTTVSGSGRYKKFGKKITVQFSAACTTVGTAAGFVRIPTPVDVRGGTTGVGIFANANTRKSGAAHAGILSANYIDCWLYDGTFPITSGETIWGTAEYETA